MNSPASNHKANDTKVVLVSQATRDMAGDPADRLNRVERRRGELLKLKDDLERQLREFKAQMHDREQAVYAKTGRVRGRDVWELQKVKYESQGIGLVTRLKEVEGELSTLKAERKQLNAENDSITPEWVKIHREMLKELRIIRSAVEKMAGTAEVTR